MDRLTDPKQARCIGLSVCGGGCESCPADNKFYRRLSAYEDTGLAPEEITRLRTERDAAIALHKGCANELDRIRKERDTLKKALELACDDLSELEYCYDYNQKTCEEDVPTACVECLSSYFIQQAQEQEGQKS